MRWSPQWFRGSRKRPDSWIPLLCGLLAVLVAPFVAAASYAAEFRVIAYREFGSAVTVAYGEPGFDPADSDITVAGEDLEHPFLTWSRGANALFIDIVVTGSGQNAITSTATSRNPCGSATVWAGHTP